MRRIASWAIQVFPEPVGAETRQSVRRAAAKAFSWKGSGLKGSFGGAPIWANTFFRRASALGLILGIFLLAALGLGLRVRLTLDILEVDDL
jgi:hypothetical protein